MAVETPVAPTPQVTPVPKLIPKPTTTDKSQAEARQNSLSGWMNDVVVPADKPEPEPVKQEVEKPTEQPKPLEQPKEPEPDKWPRTAQDWKKFVTLRDEGFKKRDDELNQLRSQLKEKDTKLTEFTASPRIDPKEHDSIKSERDKLSETLRLVAVEKHPKFQAYYDGKESQQIDLAKRIIGSDKSEALSTLLKLPDSQYRQVQLENLFLDLNPVTVARLGSVLNELESVRLERTSEVSKAREEYDRVSLKAQQDAQLSQQQSKANAEKVFTDTLKDFQDKGLPLWQPKSDDVNWNKTIEDRVALAKTLLFSPDNKPEDLVKHALNAVSFPVLLDSYNTALEENKKLLAQITELQAASPTITQNTRPPSDQPTYKRPVSGSRPMDVVKDWIGNLNQE